MICYNILHILQPVPKWFITIYNTYYNLYPNNMLQYIIYITTSTEIIGRRYNNSHIKGDQVQPCYMISFWPASKTKICFDQFFPIKKIHNTGSYQRPDDRKTIKTCSMARFRWFDESVIMSKYSQSEFWSAMSAMWVFLIDLNRLAARQQAELPKRLKGEGKTESLVDANTFIQSSMTEWKETTYFLKELPELCDIHTYIKLVWQLWIFFMVVIQCPNLHLSSSIKIC